MRFRVFQYWFPTLRHPELVSPAATDVPRSYYFDVGSKMLKRVQHDGSGQNLLCASALSAPLREIILAQRFDRA